jgi:hypothetical protein
MIKQAYSRICKRSPTSIWIYVFITSRKISEHVTWMHALTMTRTVLDTTGMVDFETAWVIVMPTFATVLFRERHLATNWHPSQEPVLSNVDKGYNFFIDLILPAALRSWGRLSLQQKWVSWISPGWCKGGRCVGPATLPPSCTDYLEIWETRPPGTLRACPGL